MHPANKKWWKPTMARANVQTWHACKQVRVLYLYAYSHIHKHTQADSNTDALTQTDTLTVTWISMWVQRHRGREMQMLLSSSQWHGIRGEMNACEKKREIAKGRDLERDGADSLCIHCVSPCPDAHHCERTCLSGSENRWQSQEDVASPTSPSLFTYVSHFSFPLSLFSSVTCLRLGRPRRRRAMAHISLFHNFPFTLLVSPSPMLLFLHSQVASRVRTGFVGAHARWRDTVTDLIAARERQADRERDKGWHDTRIFLQKFKGMHVVSHIDVFQINYIYIKRYCVLSIYHGLVCLTLWEGRH